MNLNTISDSIDQRDESSKQQKSNLLVNAFEAFTDLGLPSVRIDIASWEPVIDAKKQFGLLERAPLDIVEALELTADRFFAGGKSRCIFVGRTSIEVVSENEALLFRSERRSDFERLCHERDLTSSLSPQSKLYNAVVFGGLSNIKLFDNIAYSLGVDTGNILFSKFANGESRVIVNESVRRKEVFVMQTFSEPVNDNLAELIFQIDALKRASASEIHVVLPYFGYSRQDRKGDERAPISAAVVAKQLKTVGADRIITLDIHAEQVEGFFDGPLDNLFAYPLFTPHIFKNYGKDDLMLVAPDEGGMKRLGRFAKDIEAYFYDNGNEKPIYQACMSKTRGATNKVDKMMFIGDSSTVRGKTCVLFDDMIDTGGTLIKAASILRGLDAARVVAYATHPIFSGNAVERFREATYCQHDGKEVRLIDEIIVTDSLPLRRGRGDLISVVSMQGLLAEAIRRISEGDGASLRELKGFRGGARLVDLH